MSEALDRFRGMVMVSFVDETTSGARWAVGRLLVAEQRLTLREVIRRRVFEEAAVSEAGRVDPEQQYRSAVEAFGRNGFLVLVGDRQVEELDVELDLRQDTEVAFLKLVPLVGG